MIQLQDVHGPCVIVYEMDDWLVTRDSLENRRSIKKDAALRPRVDCFGHCPPLVDDARFVRWADTF